MLVLKINNLFSKVVLGAIAAKFHSKRLEEKVSSILVKGYKKGAIRWDDQTHVSYPKLYTFCE